MSYYLKEYSQSWQKKYGQQESEAGGHIASMVVRKQRKMNTHAASY